MLWKKRKKSNYNVDVSITETDKPGMGIKVIFSNEKVGRQKKSNKKSTTYRTPIHSSRELLDQISRTISSPFFPIKDPVLAQKVRNEIAASFASGENNKSLMTRLHNLIDSDKVIEDIVYTECVFDYSASVVAYGIESGAIGKEWSSTSLKDTCQDCMALNNKKVKIKDKFSKADIIGHPPLHKGCRCGVRVMYSNEKL